MAKVNLQIRVPEEVESEINRVAPRSKAAFVREAIEEKIRRERDQRLEDQWIRALQSQPEDVKEAQKWLKAEGWGPR